MESSKNFSWKLEKLLLDERNASQGSIEALFWMHGKLAMEARKKAFHPFRASGRCFPSFLEKLFEHPKELFEHPGDVSRTSKGSFPCVLKNRFKTTRRSISCFQSFFEVHEKLLLEAQKELLLDGRKASSRLIESSPWNSEKLLLKKTSSERTDCILWKLKQFLL